MSKGEIKVYPVCCTSAFCGRGECKGCQHEPTLREFKEWREKTGAVCSDPIWSPTVYKATK